jgi:lipopolysaccharide heptosyltransferase II
MNGHPDWHEARNVLCVRVDALGDLLMTGPAISALKRAHPERRVTVLTSPAGAAIARYMPGIDALIVHGAPWVKETAPRARAGDDRVLLAKLRTADFDAAAVFTVYSQSALPAALYCYLAGIPLRLGHCRENPYRLLTDWVPETEPQQGVRHEVQRQLDLVAHVGARTDDDRMRLSLPSESFAQAQALVAALRLGPRWAVVHPGASAPSRRYPPERFARAADLLAREYACRIVYTGTAAEAALIADIQAQMRAPSHSVAGRLDLGTLSALIALAPVIVVNNTGPAHIAAAVGTPVVDLYALTNLQHMPWRVENRVLYHDVPCKNCYKSVCPTGHHDCLRQVPPEAVARAAVELLERAPDRARVAQGAG